jgi:osmotically-inducible protein OsmY
MLMSEEPSRAPEGRGTCLPAQATGPAERAEGRLRRAGYPALQHVSCEYHDGVLTLGGRLPTYYLKQVAQEAVAGTEGVRRLDNRIEVPVPARRGDAPGLTPPPGGRHRA